jgi:hypothetical protein
MTGPAAADTTDQNWRSKVLVSKSGAHCKDDPSCFNRYHPAIKAVKRLTRVTSSPSRPAMRWTAT